MSTVNINTTNNTVSIQDTNQTISVTDNNKNTTVSIPQSNTTIVEVNTPGPQGPTGPIGPSGSQGIQGTPGIIPNTGSFATTGSNIFIGNQIVTGSLLVTGSTIQIGNNTLIGNTVLSGSLEVSGSSNFHNSEFIVTGSTSILGNFNVKGTSVFSNTTFTVTGSQYFTGSSFINGNQSLVGNSTVTGSLNVIGDINVVSGSSFTRWGNKLFNYGQFYDTTTQSGSLDTAYSMKLNTTDFALGVSIVSQSRITVENTGIYNLQFSAQLGNTANTDIDFDIWFAYTGSNIPNSNTQVTLNRPGGTSRGRLVAAWNFATPIQANDYIEIKWACTANTGVILATGSSAIHPAIPSVIATLTQIA